LAFDMPRLWASSTSVVQAASQSPQAVHLALTYAGAEVICTDQPPSFCSPPVTPAFVRTRMRGLRSRRRVLISMPHDGGHIFGK
jgi:hypothetical protein